MIKFTEYDKVNEENKLLEDINIDNMVVERFDDDEEGYTYRLKISINGKTLYSNNLIDSDDDEW